MELIFQIKSFCKDMIELKIVKYVKLEIFHKILVKLYGLNKLKLNQRNIKKEFNKFYYKIGKNILKENKLNKKLMLF